MGVPCPRTLVPLHTASPSYATAYILEPLCWKGRTRPVLRRCAEGGFQGAWSVCFLLTCSRGLEPDCDEEHRTAPQSLFC